MNLANFAPIPDVHRQMASLPQAVILLEPGQRIVAANPAAEQFFGQSFRRLAGMSLAEAVTFSEPRLLDRLQDSETPLSARNIVVLQRGARSRRIDMTVSPVADSPGWQLITFHDYSANEIFGDDSGGGEPALLRGPEIMAHEIKNPLAGIRGAAQLLARKVGRKERALTELITSEVDRIVSLIEQMQTLSRKTQAPVEPCNLHETIRRAIAVLEAGDAGLSRRRIREEFDPSIPPVLASPDGLVQIFINLLSNASEACRTAPDGVVTVRTRFASGLQLRVADSGTTLRLPVEVRISDNGPGIDPAMRDHIFEPFVTTKNSGQGLGLALVRKLVRDMNGRVGHERDEAGGLTHFRLHLPLAEDASRPVPREMAEP